MSQAIKAVLEKKKSIRVASLHYNVPKSTLGDRISGRVCIGAVSGPAKYLTADEELELCRFLVRCSAIGYPKTRTEAISLVQNIVERKGIKTCVTGGWWESFCRRHPTLTLRTPAPLSTARAHSTDPDVLHRFFDMLEEVFTTYDLHDKPCQVFNMDESGLPLDVTPSRAICVRGMKNPVAPSSGDKSQITVVACVSAGGTSMPPMVILNRKTLPPDFTVGEVPGTVYGLSARGWIDQELFRDWFCFHFLKYAPTPRPLLLLLDGHSSHYCPETIHLAAKEGVVIFVLPPNSTHILQPLDKDTFAPLKLFWREAVQRYMSKNPGLHVNRYCFSALFSQAWSRCMTMANCRAGFRVTGIFPLNRDAVVLPNQQFERLAKQSDLQYIPLVSPAPRRNQISKLSRKFTTQETKSQCDSKENESICSTHCDCLSESSVSFQRSFSLSPIPDLHAHSKRRHSSVPCHSLPPHSQIEQFLHLPSPKEKSHLKNIKSCGRILTSAENLKAIKEKQHQKEVKVKAKLERQRKREERCEAKTRSQQSKKITKIRPQQSKPKSDSVQQGNV